MHKTLKTIWVLSGILIFLWTAFWFIKVRILHEYAFVSNVIMLSIGYYLMLLYIIIAAAYFLNRKRYRKKRRKSLDIKWQTKK